MVTINEISSETRFGSIAHDDFSNMCAYCPRHDTFLSKIIQHNVVSPICSSQFLFYERLYRENNDVLLNTPTFLQEEEKKGKKRKKKRKRDELDKDDDVLQIKCYVCKENITGRARDGTLFQHACFQ